MISDRSELFNLSQHFIYWLKLCEQLILNLYRRRKAVRVGRSVSPCLSCCFPPPGCAAHSVAVRATSSCCCSHVDRVHLFCVIVTELRGLRLHQWWQTKDWEAIFEPQQYFSKDVQIANGLYFGMFLWTLNILEKPYSNKRDWYVLCVLWFCCVIFCFILTVSTALRFVFLHIRIGVFKMDLREFRLEISVIQLSFRVYFWMSHADKGTEVGKIQQVKT